MEPFEDLRRAFRLSVVTCGAIVASLFIYALIMQILRSVLRPFSGLAQNADIQMLRYIFYGLAIVLVVLVRFVGRALTRPKPRESHQLVIQKLSRAAIITATLAEIPAILGFILFLLTGAGGDFYYLLFVSLVLEFIYFPRLKTWEEILRTHYSPSET